MRPASNLLCRERFGWRVDACLGVPLDALKHHRPAPASVWDAVRYIIPPLIGVLEAVAYADKFLPVLIVLQDVGKNASDGELHPEIHSGGESVGRLVYRLAAHEAGKRASEHHVSHGGGDNQVPDLKQGLFIDLFLSLGRKW